MELTPKTTVLQSPQIASRNISGRMILLKAPLSTLHTLNSVGEFIWKKIEKPRTISELCDAVSDRFEVAGDQAERDIVEFIEKLHRQNLVTIKNE